MNVSVSDDMMQMSEEFYQSIDNITDDITASMQAAAKELSPLTPDDPKAQAILRNLFNEYPNSAGIAWVSADNTVISVPIYSMGSVLTSSEFQNITEQSFAGQDVILTDPVMSNVYGMVVCFVVPVYTADGSYNGYLCFAHMPIILLNETPDTPYYKDTLYELWIVNSNGTIIYHPDTSTIGKNYYTSHYYQEHSKISDIRPFIENSEGTLKYLSYSLRSSDVVEKVGIWNTLSFGGQDLRLVLVDYPYKATDVTFPENVNIKEVTDVTQALFIYAKKYGKEATLVAMSDPSGPFSNTETEIFAISTDGVVLSMPTERGLMGGNQINYQDAYGIRQVATMINRVNQGGGYVHYYSKLPYAGNETIFGLAYVIPVDETWFVGSQKSLLNHTVSFDPEVRSKLVRAVQPVQEYVSVYGKEQTLATLNDPSGDLIYPDVRFAAVSYEGELLADIFNSDLIGIDMFSVVDPHGTSTFRDFVLIAKQGGGFEYVESRNAEDGLFTISLMYVEPVDDEWFIAGSIKLDSHPIPS
ncbi:hypothetical protein McpSp1_01730 [Methanocorpusculaceae archaeon Sp1]|uniref:Cache domain-containing protein n=2 Tax=Methanorbis furvi TaxID=3028299 RepID=A0AAE4MCP7_9EURY|nr:hypothetical protein [Methanocorpusculaceae archaeon Sp1]MDV0441819.1 hypothetical protein [Methanocorpusculaceae archaeon Ag1]